jgi:hypothetical protein
MGVYVAKMEGEALHLFVCLLAWKVTFYVVVQVFKIIIILLYLQHVHSPTRLVTVPMFPTLRLATVYVAAGGNHGRAGCREVFGASRAPEGERGWLPVLGFGRSVANKTFDRVWLVLGGSDSPTRAMDLATRMRWSRDGNRQ